MVAVGIGEFLVVVGIGGHVLARRADWAALWFDPLVLALLVVALLVATPWMVGEVQSFASMGRRRAISGMAGLAAGAQVGIIIAALLIARAGLVAGWETAFAVAGATLLVLSLGIGVSRSTRG